MKRKTDHIDVTVYQAAPDLLLDAIARAEGKLAGQEKSTGYKFWKGVVADMRFAFNYIEDMGYVYVELSRLRSQVRWLQDENTKLLNELARYGITEGMLADGSILEVIDRIEKRGRLIDTEIKEKLKKYEK